MLPDAAVFWDEKGEEAQRFGVATSGHVLVFDRSGVRQFSGGVTASRGHEGASLGIDTIAKILKVESPGGESSVNTIVHDLKQTTEVFGCPIWVGLASSNEANEGQSLSSGAK